MHYPRPPPPNPAHTSCCLTHPCACKHAQPLPLNPAPPSRCITHPCAGLGRCLSYPSVTHKPAHHTHTSNPACTQHARQQQPSFHGHDLVGDGDTRWLLTSMHYPPPKSCTQQLLSLTPMCRPWSVSGVPLGHLQACTPPTPPTQHAASVTAVVLHCLPTLLSHTPMCRPWSVPELPVGHLQACTAHPSNPARSMHYNSSLSRGHVLVGDRDTRSSLTSMHNPPLKSCTHQLLSHTPMCLQACTTLASEACTHQSLYHTPMCRPWSVPELPVGHLQAYTPHTSNPACTQHARQQQPSSYEHVLVGDRDTRQLLTSMHCPPPKSCTQQLLCATPMCRPWLVSGVPLGHLQACMPSTLPTRPAACIATVVWQHSPTLPYSCHGHALVC
jgi:hypothetical protein